LPMYKCKISYRISGEGTISSLIAGMMLDLVVG